MYYQCLIWWNCVNLKKLSLLTQSINPLFADAKFGNKIKEFDWGFPHFGRKYRFKFKNIYIDKRGCYNHDFRDSNFPAIIDSFVNSSSRITISNLEENDWDMVTFMIVKPQEVIFVLGCNLWFVSNREFDDWMDESEDFQFKHSPKLYNIIGIHEKTFKIDGFYCLKTPIPDVILSKW